GVERRVDVDQINLASQARRALIASEECGHREQVIAVDQTIGRISRVGTVVTPEVEAPAILRRDHELTRLQTDAVPPLQLLQHLCRLTLTRGDDAGQLLQ